MDDFKEHDEPADIKKLSEADLSLLLYRSKIEKARNVLTHLTTAKKNEAFYPPQHPIAIQSLEALYSILKDCALEEKQITINIYEDELFYGELPLTEESLIYSQFIEECDEREIGSIIFLPDLELSEVKAFIHLLNQEPDALARRGGLPKALQEEKITHIKVSEIKPLVKREEEKKEISEEETNRLAKETYGYAINTIHEIMDSIAQNQTPNVQKAKNVVRSMVDLITRDRQALLGLTSIKNYDQYTYYHSVNVLILALALGSNLPLKKVPLSILGISALLHDIGKIRIPLDIIKKPGPLTSEEWKTVEKHPLEGAEILSSIPGLNKTAMIVAFEHHIGFDLSGYPKISPKRSLHLYSKIVEIADAYDAMTSRTYYRSPETPDNALSIMLQLSGAVFDPLLLKVFINMMGIYPIGTLVRLDTRDIAVVYRTNPNDILRPKVKLLRDVDGNDLAAEITDLTETNEKNQFKRSIERSLDAEAMKIDVTKYV
jgi:putative nucleotidyltransferase with HDIG domain